MTAVAELIGLRTTREGARVLAFPLGPKTNAAVDEHQ